MYFLLAGLGGGMAVNALSDWLSIRRELVGEAHAAAFGTTGYVQFLLFPFQGFPLNTRWKARIAVVWALSLAASLWLGLAPLPEVSYAWAFPLLLYLTLVTVMDIEHKVILFPVAIAGALLALLVGVALRGWAATLLGGAAGFGLMLSLFLIAGVVMNWFTRWRGDAEVDDVPLGFGDVNLSGIMGLLLGWPGITAGLILTILLGGLAGIVFIIGMKLKGNFTPYLAIPYGPNLVLAIFILLYFRGFF